MKRENAYTVNESVKLDPTDKKSVREKFLASTVVAVTCLDGQVKILKNRIGQSGQTIPQFAFQTAFANVEGVWLLTWMDAQQLLKGLVSL